jgi:hypothetical protein
MKLELVALETRGTRRAGVDIPLGTRIGHCFASALASSIAVADEDDL